MSDVVIRVVGLGKQYRLGKRERYRTLRDTLADTFTAPFRYFRSGASSNGEPETFWALKELSFEVKRGQVIGVIGRNGAGKSTLLKILSRITAPTEGFAEICGRVGSLLEVGTGFHPELSGRENIYLNGAILGMKHADIRRKFDEIVAFAELEKFIDTPVKHFSSGMYTRLAFAVAAHLEPDILIIDEVLAVGDAQFQQRCLGKMGEVARGGRTVIFVSHQMNQIRRLCSEGIWLQDGTVRNRGEASMIVSAYESYAANSGGGPTRTLGVNAKAEFVDWRLDCSEATDNLHTITGQHPIRVCFSLHVSRKMDSTFHGIALQTLEGQVLWGHGTPELRFEPGTYEIEYSISSLPLRPGAYQWLVSLHDEGGLVDLWECSPHLVVSTPPFNRALDRWSGCLNPAFEMKVVHSAGVTSQFSSLLKT
jgi:lipopolysaccharide transport system ATP-binding protein